MSKNLKEWILAIILVVAGVLFWFSFNLFLPELSWEITPLFISTVLVAFCLMVVWGLIALLVENSLVVFLAWGAVSYAGLLWILDPLLIGASSILFLFGVIGFFRTKSQVHNTMEGGVTRPLRKVIPLTATALVAVIAVAAYLRTPATQLDVSQVLPEKVFMFVLRRAEPIIQKSYDPTFVADREVGNVAPLMAQQFGIEVAPKDTFGRALYRIGTAFIIKQTEHYKVFFPVAYALSLFVTLRFMALVLNWVVIFAVYLFLKACIKVGIVELRSIPRTVIEYSFK